MTATRLPAWLRFAAPVAVGLLGLALWFAYVASGSAPRMLPDPLAIAGELTGRMPLVAEAAAITGTNALVGLVAGSVVAVANGPGSILLFAGIDPKNAMVEVVASGIPLSGANGQPAAAPTGPAQLRVSYASTVPAQAAIAPNAVPPGAF